MFCSTSNDVIWIEYNSASHETKWFHWFYFHLNGSRKTNRWVSVKTYNGIFHFVRFYNNRDQRQCDALRMKSSNNLRGLWSEWLYQESSRWFNHIRHGLECSVYSFECKRLPRALLELLAWKCQFEIKTHRLIQSATREYHIENLKQFICCLLFS